MTPYIVTVQKIEKNRGFLRRIVYQNAKICIAASSAIKKYFEEIGVKNIAIIPNGIDLEKFKNLDQKKSRENLEIKNEFLIITVARLEKVKGIEYLIKAAKIISINQQNQYKSVFLIIGDGSQRKNLENLVRKLNLEDKVRFLGQIPNEKIPEYLVAADCFVLPSLREGFGIVILEAMACGVPVIGTNVGGIPDIIKDGENGILVEPKNSEKLAEAIFKIHSNHEFAKSLAENAMANSGKYNWQSIVEKVYKIYQSLIL
jgi:glycosyltransferase involved in cell wall biosynthesis